MLRLKAEAQKQRPPRIEGSPNVRAWCPVGREVAKVGWKFTVGHNSQIIFQMALRENKLGD